MPAAVTAAQTATRQATCWRPAARRGGSGSTPPARSLQTGAGQARRSGRCGARHAAGLPGRRLLSASSAGGTPRGPGPAGDVAPRAPFLPSAPARPPGTGPAVPLSGRASAPRTRRPPQSPVPRPRRAHGPGLQQARAAEGRTEAGRRPPSRLARPRTRGQAAAPARGAA